MYKLESESINRWIAMCPGPIHGRLGWCIGNESTMETDTPVLYGKIMHLKKDRNESGMLYQINLNSNFVLFF